MNQAISQLLSLATTSLLLLVLLGIGPALAQPPEEEPETPLDIEIETPEFQQAVDALREHLCRMNEIIVYYHVGKDSEDRKWREKWLELTAEGHTLHEAMVEAALAEYLMDPLEKQDLGEMLYRILKRNCEADRFEGMFPVAKALVDNDFPKPLLLNYAAQSAYALGDFQTAKQYFDVIIERGNATDGLKLMRQSLDDYQEIWAEELRKRELDAQGQPLPRALIKTTKGDMEVELFENQAPNTVANFIHLAETGFYDGRDFFQVMELIAQTGCPNEDGSGGPGYTIASEVDHPNHRKFFRGTLGLALAQDTQTGIENNSSGGSQFFIAFLPLPDLNDRYTAFGRVVKGIEVLPCLQKIDPNNKGKEAEGEETSVPDEVITIEVLFKRDHEYAPKKL